MAYGCEFRGRGEERGEESSLTQSALAINSSNLQIAYLGGSTLSAVQGIDYFIKATDTQCTSQ